MKEKIYEKGRRMLAVFLSVAILLAMLPVQDLAAKPNGQDTAHKNTGSMDDNEENSATDDSSSSAGSRHKALSQGEQQRLIEESLKGAQPAPQADATGNGKVLLIEDNLPWDSTANHTILSSLTSYKKVTTGQFRKTDLSEYAVIMFANDQSFSTYSNYAEFKEYIEAYVSIGGVVIFGACDSGWANGKLVEELPGGVTKGNNYLYRNQIADYSHPIITGQYSNGISLTNDDLYNNYCSHVYFNEDSLPQGSNVIIRGTDGRPTLVEYPWGKGKVIASGLTWEHNYIYGEDKGYGMYAQKVMDDLVLYALGCSQVDSKDLRSLLVYRSYQDEVLVYAGDRSTQDKIYQAKVTIGSDTEQTDSLGMAHFAIPEGNYTVTVSADGYETQKRILDLKKGSMEPFYLEKSSGNNVPYLTMAYASYGSGKIRDLRMERLNYKEDEETECTVTLAGDWAGHPAGDFILYQGAKQVKARASSITFKPGETFSADKPVYCMMLSTDGTKSKAYQTGITIREKSSGFIWTDKEVKTGFTIGQKTGFTIGGDLPIIGGTSFEVSMDDIPLSIVTEDNKVQIAFGGTDVKSVEENWKDLKKKIDEACKTADRIDRCRDIMEAFGAKSGSFSLGGSFSKPELEVSGYAEGVWDEKTGKITNLTGRLLLGTSVKYTYSHQFVVGPVPVYFEIGGGASLELDAKVTKVLTETGQIEVSLPITFTPNFTIGGGVGINGALSVGAEGSVDLPIEMDIPQKHVKVSLKGGMSLKASMLFVFKAEKKILEGTWVILDKYYNDAKEAAVFDYTEGAEAISEDMALPFEEASSYELEDRSYLAKTSGWNAGQHGAPARSRNYSYNEILQDYMLPGTQPQLEKAGDTAVLIFQADNGRDGVDYTQLMYTYWNGSGFAEPQPVWESAAGESDYQASLKADGDSLYLVWQRKKAASDASLAGNLEEGVSDGMLSEIASKMEIAAAVWNPKTASFEGQRYLTENDVYDGMPRIATGHGKAEAVWVQNNANHLLGKGGMNKMYHADIRSGQTPEQLLSTPEYISGLDAGYDAGGALMAAYTIDTDGDLNTSADTEAYLWRNGNATALTKDDTADLNAQISGGMVFWYKEGQIMSYHPADGTTAPLWEDGTLAGSAFQIVEHNGSRSVIWGSAAATKEPEDSIVIRSSSDGNHFGAPSILASPEGALQYFDVALLENGTYLTVYSSKTEEDNYILASQLITPQPDLEVIGVSAFDRERKDGIQPFSITVQNNGLAEASAVNAAFYRNGRQIEDVALETIAPGEKKTITKEIYIGEQEEVTPYRVAVSDENEDAVTEANEAEVSLGYNDIAIETKEYYIQNKLMLFVKLRNLTDRTADAKVSIHEDSAEGKVLVSRTAEDLAPDEEYVFQYEIHRGQMDVPLGEDKYYYVEAFAEDENSFTDNEAVVLIPTSENEVTDVSLGRERQIVVDIKDKNQKTIQLKADVLPQESPNKAVSWESSDVSVAKVDSTGKIQVQKAGTAEITVTTEENGCRDSIMIYAVDPIRTAPTSVKITGVYDSVNLSWKKAKGITNYEVLRATSKNGTYKSVGRTNSDTYKDYTAEFAKTYYYKVRGYQNYYGALIYGNASGALAGKAQLGAAKLEKGSVSHKQLEVRIARVEGADGYMIYRSTKKDKGYKKIATTAYISYIDRTVKIGEKYYYKAAAYKKISGKTYEGPKGNILSLKPELLPPYYLSLSAGDYRSATVYTSMPSDIRGCEIFRSTNEKKGYKKIATTNTGFYLDNSLQVGKTYYYKVRHYIMQGQKRKYSRFTNPYSYTPGLAAPQNATAHPAASSQIRISWEKTAGAAGYEVLRADSYSGPYKLLKSVSKLSYVDTKAGKDVYRYYKVRPYRKVKGKKVYGMETGAFSAKAYFAPPTELKISYPSYKSLKLTWRQMSDGKKTEVSYSDSYYGTYKTLANTDKNSYVHKNLKAGVTYYYKLRTYKVVNKKKIYTDYGYISGRTRLPAASGLKASSAGAKAIKLSWKKTNGATIYYIYRAVSQNGSYSKIGESTKASYTDKEVAAGNQYFYKVMSYRILNGEYLPGDASEPVMAVPKLSRPSALKCKSVSAKSQKLTWKKDGQAAGYEIYCSRKKGSGYKKIAATKKTSYTNKKLPAKTMYYKIRSYRLTDGEKMYSPWSAIVKGKVKKK